jgi:DNA-binding IclR family transcriptional regulator
MLLECLDAAHPTLTLSQAVRRTGMPKTSVHRLLHEMAAQGWLEHRNGRYRVGQRLFELGTLSPMSRGLREAALPHMQELVFTTHETVQLGVVADREVLYIERLRGPGDRNPLPRIGSRLPLHCTALGKVLLAYGCPALRESMQATDLVARTNLTVRSGSVLGREVELVAQRGVAFEREEALPGVGCVAAPILSGDGHALAALAISTPAARGRLDQLAPAVRMAAHRLSRQLNQLVEHL